MPEEAGDKIIEANVKRNSLIFVGDAPLFPQSPEHAALEAQYKKLQTDFDTVKDFLKHLFHHALTMSSTTSSSTPSSTTSTPPRPGRPASYYSKGTRSKDEDINTFDPIYSKQLEHSLEDIHGEISQLRNSQDQQQVRMEQVQMALDNVLNQSSVRNDVTMRMVRQQDKLKEMQRHVAYLETHLMGVTNSLRQVEEKLCRVGQLQQNLDHVISSSSRNLKGNSKSDLIKISDGLVPLAQTTSYRAAKISAANKMVSHIAMAASNGQTLLDSKPPVDVLESFSKLERLIGTDWHRFGRMLALTVDCLDDIGKFTNFDLTTRVEKVMATWTRTLKGANGEFLKEALTKMDRDILLLADIPVSKDLCPVSPDVLAFFVAHVVDVSTLCHDLAWQGILSQDSMAFILGVPEEYKRASRLIHSIVFMGLTAIQTLCHALDSYNQTHVSFKLKGCLPGSEGGNENAWELHSAATLPHNANSPYHSPVSNNGKKQNNNKSDASLKDSSASSHRPKSREKNRTKRSRSLFTRKNKLRDNDALEQTVVDHREEADSRNTYYPVSVV